MLKKLAGSFSSLENLNLPTVRLEFRAFCGLADQDDERSVLSGLQKS